MKPTLNEATLPTVATETAVSAQTTTASTGTPGSVLPLRKDEPVSVGFMLETLLALVVLLGAVSLALKWFVKRRAGKWPVRQNRRLNVLESVRVSARTRVTLLDVDGLRAAVIETPQGASLQFVPLDAGAAASTTASHSTHAAASATPEHTPES